jgi:hypothetical protein
MTNVLKISENCAMLKIFLLVVNFQKGSFPKSLYFAQTKVGV